MRVTWSVYPDFDSSRSASYCALAWRYCPSKSAVTDSCVSRWSLELGLEIRQVGLRLSQLGGSVQVFLLDLRAAEFQ